MHSYCLRAPRRFVRLFPTWTLGVSSPFVANENMAKALATKGFHYQFVFARNAGHTDRTVKLETLPEALEYIWQGYLIERVKR